VVRSPDAQKRRAVLKAARAAFVRDGFHAATMDDIARLAKVSKRTVYAYFPSKDALLIELAMELWSRLSPGAEPPLQNRSLAARLTDLASRRIKVLLDEDLLVLLRTVLAETARAPDLVRTFVSGNTEYFGQLGLRAVLHEEIGRGRLRIADVTLATGQFWGLLLDPLFWPLVLGVRTPPSPHEIDRVVEEAIATFLARYGVAKRKGRS
jgi:AcrR family transcriptional regulator